MCLCFFYRAESLLCKLPFMGLQAVEEIGSLLWHFKPIGIDFPCQCRTHFNIASRCFHLAVGQLQATQDTHPKDCGRPQKGSAFSTELHFPKCIFPQSKCSNLCFYNSWLVPKPWMDEHFPLVAMPGTRYFISTLFERASCTVTCLWLKR